MSSKNYGAMKSLASAIPGGLTPGQEFSLVNRVVDDLNDVYTAVFTGPLPANDAVNLTNIQRSALPANIAWTDLANAFSESQTVAKDNSSINIIGTEVAFIAKYSAAATKPTRLIATADGRTLLGSGVNYTGGAYSDDGGNNSGIILNDGYAFSIIKYLAGVITHTLRVNSGGQTSIGPLATLTSLLVNELGLANSKFIRGTNAGGSDNYPLVGLNGNNLVFLGRASNTGDGCPAIPNDTFANMPGAGATRDGIMLLDKTNNRIIYYVSGNRYFMPVGTSF